MGRVATKARGGKRRAAHHFMLRVQLVEEGTAYVNHLALIGDTESLAVDFTTFLAEPGLGELRADEDGQWEQINAAVSPRAWCWDRERFPPTRREKKGLAEYS